MKRAVGMIGILAVAACRVPIPEPTNDTPMENVTLMNESAEQPVKAPSAASKRSTIRAFPDGFLGRFGLVPADCTSTRGDAKGLMTVERDRLRFYESTANIDRIEPVSAAEVLVTLTFSGEGQTWREETPLRLEDNGNAIVRTTQGQQLRYTRCDQ